MNNWYILVTLFLSSSYCFAAVPTWKMLPAQSHIQFTGIQNDSPVSGEFKKFTADIRFDPNQLGESHVKVMIDMNSIYASYAEIVSTLKTTAWFDAINFPTAVFESTEFSKISNNTYSVKGNLTIRDKTAPVTLTFNGSASTGNIAQVMGSTEVKRSVYGVGSGEWADTSLVKDNVKINFVIAAARQ